MSTVFKARAKESSAAKVVALKVTTPSLMTPPHDSVREARLLDVCKHQAVVPLLDSFREGGRFVLVFPFLRQDLENLLRTANLTKRQSRLVFTALFEALASIHSLGIIHRDVKPSNILLESMDGPIYLADFGIAWSPSDKGSEPADDKITDVGTTCYRPPELLFGDRSYDCSLDMWAAGCVVAEMVKKGHYPIFDPGPLGSELGLIKSMFTTLGTPNDETWPVGRHIPICPNTSLTAWRQSAQTYPDWRKIRFQQFPGQRWQEILPGASDVAIDFVSKTVCFEKTKRLTAKEVCLLSYGLMSRFQRLTLHRHWSTICGQQWALNDRSGLLETQTPAMMNLRLCCTVRLT
jgi:cyclin-dependent kinase